MAIRLELLHSQWLMESLSQNSCAEVLGEVKWWGWGNIKGVDMQVPAVFLAAAAWAEGRPFGDAAGMAVRELLTELTGPPRIGVCTVDAPVDVVVPRAVMVRTYWPAVGSGTDVVLLLHPGAVPGRLRSRMRIGPQSFVHIENKEQAENFTLTDPELAEIRARQLGCELRALAMRFPELGELIPDREQSGVPQPRAAVIGPDAPRVAEIKARLEPHVHVVDSADVDVVVAVPGARGFMLIDAPTIQDAWQRVGRLVVLSPLPAGVCPQAVPAGRDLVATIKRLAAMPAGAGVPTVSAGRWIHALERIEGKQREGVKRLRLADDREGMRRLARARGVELAPNPRMPTRDLVLAVLVVVAVCLFRVDMLPVVLGIVGVRMAHQRSRELGRWWDGASISVSLDTTSCSKRDNPGPRGWLRGMWFEGEKSG